MADKKKSTLKILDYLQQNMPSEKELTGKKPGVKKPKTVQEQPEINELDQDFADAIQAEEPVPGPYDADVPVPVGAKKKKSIFDGMA